MKKRELVKAEILWSRKCNVGCQYCNMTDGRNNTLSVDEWCRGIYNLKELGCGFIAFYGAEPLLEFDKLPSVIGYAESLGIYTTVITSGLVPDFHKKLVVLYEAGLRSLSMSYDIKPISKESELKLNEAAEGLEWFQCYANNRDGYRDVAAIATLTSKNFRALPDSIRTNSMRNIWTFFDLIHKDRGQPGSKCRNFLGIDDLIFKPEDLGDLSDVLLEVEALKKEGALCHSSVPFLKILRAKTENNELDYNWNCADDRERFPSWVTIDCDGMVYPCDDFQPRDIIPNMKINYLTKGYNWNIFKKFWLRKVKKECPGCLWNTHIDAHFIKAGNIPFSDYVHTKE